MPTCFLKFIFFSTLCSSCKTWLLVSLCPFFCHLLWNFSWFYCLLLSVWIAPYTLPLDPFRLPQLGHPAAWFCWPGIRVVTMSTEAWYMSKTAAQGLQDGSVCKSASQTSLAIWVWSPEPMKDGKKERPLKVGCWVPQAYHGVYVCALTPIIVTIKKQPHRFWGRSSYLRKTDFC